MTSEENLVEHLNFLVEKVENARTVRERRVCKRELRAFKKKYPEFFQDDEREMLAVHMDRELYREFQTIVKKNQGKTISNVVRGLVQQYVDFFAKKEK